MGLLKSRLTFPMLVILLFMLVLLSACSSSSENTSHSEEANIGEETTIEFWYGVTGEAEQAYKDLAKKFEEKNPNIKVKMTYVANMMAGGGEKLLASIASGNSPDVAYFDRFQIGSWAAQGALSDLTERAKADNITSDDFYNFAWNEANYEQKLYGLPVSTDARMLYYNKDLFKKAGLDPENPPKTITEIEEAAKKLTIKEGNNFKQIGFIPHYSQGFLYTWGWAFGGDYYDESNKKVTANDPKIIEALQWLKDYAREYGVNEIASFTDSQGGGEENNPFLTGQLGMLVGGNELIAQIEKYKPELNYGVTTLPTPSGDKKVTWSGGWSLIMPKGAKNPDAAWEFMKFAASEEGQALTNGKAKTLAVTDSVNEKLGYTEDPIMKEFVEVLPLSSYRPVISQGSLLWNELKRVTELALYKNQDPKSLLDEVNKQVNSELAKTNNQ